MVGPTIEHERLERGLCRRPEQRPGVIHRRGIMEGLMLPFKLACKFDGTADYVRHWSHDGEATALTDDPVQAYMFRAMASGCGEAYFVIEPALAGDIWERYHPVPWG